MIVHDKRGYHGISALVVDITDHVDSPSRRKAGMHSVTLVGKDYDQLGKIRRHVNDAYRKMVGEESPLAFTLIVPGCMNDLTEVHICGVLDLAQANTAQRKTLRTWVQNNSHLMVNFVEVHNE